jgi:hypothetical protein
MFVYDSYCRVRASGGFRPSKVAFVNPRMEDARQVFSGPGAGWGVSVGARVGWRRCGFRGLGFQRPRAGRFADRMATSHRCGLVLVADVLELRQGGGSGLGGAGGAEAGGTGCPA